MQKASWTTDNDWKTRYSKLYKSHHLIRPKEEPAHRLSFLIHDEKPDSLSAMMRIRANIEMSAENVAQSDSSVKTLLSQQSDMYGSHKCSIRSNSMGPSATLLLDMVRARTQSAEAQDKMVDLPKTTSDDESSDHCIHGYSNMRMTDRSISRSRVSRVSTRRDMDIPSILAFQVNPPPASASQGIPAFKKGSVVKVEDIPKWSIRRSMCPVCSQKWKDKSSINIIKSSGLKRNSSLDFPSVVLPARLRSQITKDYFPRPALSSIDETSSNIHRAMRNTSTAWQLTRARRFRTPKLQLPPLEDRAPPSITAPMARKDLNSRVNRFLSDDGVANLSFTRYQSI